jgi:hypothetical protein
VPCEVAEFIVTEIHPGSYLVKVSDRRATEHTVEVPTGLAETIAGPGASDAELVRESFLFLLEREPNTSILRTFSVEVIGDYFPEWTAEMSGRLRRRATGDG